MPPSWDNFFIMAGTAAATLTGLLFVAITAGTGFSRSRIVSGSRNFLTPTLFRFGAVLFQVFAVLAPWPSSRPIGIIIGLGGLAGLGYQIHVMVMGHEGIASALPSWRGWLSYVGVPALACASLVVGAVGLIAEKPFAPYAIAGATTLLLFAGAYGAWELTLWIVENRDST
jgi:hypothetical protein